MLDTIPGEIFHDTKNLTITWKDGFKSVFDLLSLRKNCPCATCRGGHGGKIGAATGHITEISLLSWKKVGRYAINIVWSDYHDTGIYTYDKLRAFSEGKTEEF
ncbi:MAG: DUF971 domain-containing protein [Leptospiraceae bacterium]|nr:DUF971 domain-containing protein [Leptospiraceae bacterium]